jgi:tripartite-type tricarboxylate transporter receptor subunit TctC
MTIVRLAIVAALSWLTAPCLAQVYPTKPVRLVVPWPPGGYADFTARIFAQHLTERLGQQMVVENKPGAAAVIGTESVAKARADGYTLLWTGATPVTTNPVILSNLPYDPIKSFAPISIVSNAALALLAHPSLPANNLGELVAFLRAKREPFAYGSFGNGSSSHFAAEMLWSTLGVKMLHVPYKGGAPLMVDLMAGQVLLGVDTVPNATPHLRTGRIKALAVSTEKRSRFLPDVPTVAELGNPGYRVDSWNGLVAPAGTPEPVLARLREETKRITASKAFQDAYAVQNVDAVFTTPEEFVALVQRDIERFAKIAREANIRSD